MCLTRFLFSIKSRSYRKDLGESIHIFQGFVSCRVHHACLRLDKTIVPKMRAFTKVFLHLRDTGFQDADLLSTKKAALIQSRINQSRCRRQSLF